MFQSLLSAPALIAALTAVASPAPSHAPGAVPAAAAAAQPGAPAPYDKFIANATPQHGLFTIWRSGGNVAIELKKDQLDKDFIELGVPVNGIGNQLYAGTTDLQAARIIRFERQDDKVAILFPSTRFLATPNTPVANAVANATAPTVVGVAKVLAEDKATGTVVIDASPFLADVTDVADALSDVNGGRLNPLGGFHFDPSKSYFGTSKAFPDNVIINVNQTFGSLGSDQPALEGVSPDARSIGITVQYDIASLPEDDDYMPRLYDDRVGYFVNAHDDFSRDSTVDKSRNYIVRWNVQPSDPTKPMSPAKKPVVYYLSNSIPQQYRDPIRKALLTWNKAFEKIGISNVVEVKDQPNDPNFDPDDIRYNVVRWITLTEGGFAEAEFVYNPYNGEMIKSGITVDSDLMRFGKFEYPVIVADGSSTEKTAERELGGADFVNGARINYAYGLVAQSINGAGESMTQYTNDFLTSIVLHESGHDFGLRHNFIAAQAYSDKDLQSKAFTLRYGVTTSVMAYSPLNIWPKGTPQGTYFQTVLGPYDYYAIHWGYARVANAKTPDDELPVLKQWASKWSDPLYRWSSDEDVSWYDGAAVDPRNQQFDLSSDNIGWCNTQMGMSQHLLSRVDQHFPAQESSYDNLRFATVVLLGQYGRCTQIVSRYIGGEYVSRALRGDPHASLPLTAVPISVERRAFDVLNQRLFAASAWNVDPTLLRELVTQYRYDDWLTNTPSRHDISADEYPLLFQRITLVRLFSPVMLQRLDDMGAKYPGHQTMELSDLFTWMQGAVYADVKPGDSIALSRRNLQRLYTKLLARLASGLVQGVPPDAQAMARYELRDVIDRTDAALSKGGASDLETRAHLAALRDDANQALKIQPAVVVQLH